MKKTIVIELFAGPGAGKSTMASHLFSALKYKAQSVELVREYAKDRIWEGLEVSSYTQPIIVGHQFQRELFLYNKVDFIVTDAPLELTGIFYKEYEKSSTLLDYVRHNMDLIDKKKGVTRIKVKLERTKNYIQAGRNETLEQAKAVDKLLDANINYDCKTKGEAASVARLVDFAMEALND